MTSAKRQRLSRGLLKVGEMAEEAGVRTSTVKFYTDEGLIDVAAYTKGGYRLYDKEKALKKILLIKQLTRRKLSLNDIVKMRLDADETY